MEHYHEVVCEALHYVCEKDAVAQDIPTDAKLAFFNETRRVGSSDTSLRGGVLDKGDRALSVKRWRGFFFGSLRCIESYWSSALRSTHRGFPISNLYLGHLSLRGVFVPDTGGSTGVNEVTGDRGPSRTHHSTSIVVPCLFLGGRQASRLFELRKIPPPKKEQESICVSNPRGRISWVTGLQTAFVFVLLDTRYPRVCAVDPSRPGENLTQT